MVAEAFRTAAPERREVQVEQGGRGPPVERIAWVDTARALCILLVVAWHTLDRRHGAAPLLVFVPIPLFFFIAGFFARKTLTRPWRDMADSEGVRLLYLYVLWACITFLLVAVPRAYLDGGTPEWRRLPLMFTWPFETLWFAYALAIVFLLARLSARAPVWLTGLFLAALYAASVRNGAWFQIGFLDRLGRAALPFFLGALLFPWAAATIPRHRNWWPLAVALYVPLTWVILENGLTGAAPLTFAATLIGIAAALTFSAWLQRFPAVPTPLNLLGASTFAVYVLHRIVLFYWGLLQDAADVPARLRGPSSAIAVIVISLALGAAILRWTPWLFDPPWQLRGRPRRGFGIGRRPAGAI